MFLNIFNHHGRVFFLFLIRTFCFSSLIVFLIIFQTQIVTSASYLSVLSGGAVAEWSKALLLREKINENPKRSQVRPPTWATFKKIKCYHPRKVSGLFKPRPFKAFLFIPFKTVRDFCQVEVPQSGGDLSHPFHP